MTLFAGWLDVTPIPKQRARVVNGRAYTPSRTQFAEQDIVTAYLYKHRGELHAGDLIVTAVIYVTHRRRVDSDNLLKTLLDALTGVAWRDDSQVVGIASRLVRGSDRSGIQLRIDPAHEETP
ncbi:MAG: RusA family crossover junction endodeoxyribonuclease [Actinobacteria bacterium]|nr:RusA family crossover junction endodeoxyribonuclease [Actinomycetota bacterium]